MHKEANCNALTGQSFRKLGSNKTLNKQLLTVPIRLEKVHVLQTLCLLSLSQQKFCSSFYLITVRGSVIERHAVH